MTELAKTSREFLAGTVSAAMPGYEPRDSQIEMMDAWAGVLASGGVLLSEAGTGTGKTFAYLIPILLSGKQAIISTKTINLQEQLASKDLAFFSSLSEFDYAVAKGRGRFLCLRRLNAFHPADDEESLQRKRLYEWSLNTESGDLEDYGEGRTALWEKVCSDSDACRGKKCDYFGKCFYFMARRTWESASIVIVNHALLTLNAMMPGDNKLLPQAEALVIDEAHSLDSVVSEQTGINLSSRGIEALFNKLLKVDGRGIYRGVLAKSPFIFEDLESLRIEAGLFWNKVAAGLEHRKTIKGRFALHDALLGLSGTMAKLIEKIKASPSGLFSEDEEVELKAALLKLRSFSEEMEVFSEGVEGFVRWAEIEGNKLALRMAPIYPSDFVSGTLFPEYGSVLLTSATLSMRGDFGLIRKTLGLERPETLSVPSPFHLKEQVRIEIRRGIDFQLENGIVRLADAVVREASREQGGTLVLFTSKDAMMKTWNAAHPRLSEAGLNPMVQGETPNRQMLEIMRTTLNSVIFGVDSFWEGVDVRGKALNCLIITKLPFEVPSEPITAARTDEIRTKGGNPFLEYSLPRAVLKFRQGFGRLIRSKEDRGRVIICDERIETKDYGRKFLESIY